MTQKDSKEQMDNDEKDPKEKASKMNSGNPNIVDPTKKHSTEHKSGYGGEGGKPRKSP